MFNDNVKTLYYVSDASPRDEHTARTWFRFERQQDPNDNIVWVPVEVQLDKHDNPEENRVYVQPDHSLVITDITTGKRTKIDFITFLCALVRLLYCSSQRTFKLMLQH
jgi:hypothetical protein